MTRSAIQDIWFERAASKPKRVVLADAGDDRANEAARRLATNGLAEPILVDSLDAVRTPAVIAAAAEVGERANLDDPLHVAALMVRAGEADGCVAGASRRTADVLRAAIHLLGVAPDPNPVELATVAVSSARTFAQLSGEPPESPCFLFRRREARSTRESTKCARPPLWLES